MTTGTMISAAPAANARRTSRSAASGSSSQLLACDFPDQPRDDVALGLDPNKSRIIARRYAKDNMPELVRLLRNFREKLLAQGWDGKVEWTSRPLLRSRC